MRLMVTYLDGDGEYRVADFHSDTLKFSPADIRALGHPGCDAVASIVEVPEGMDYDKTLYGQSTSMFPHTYALMITKASTNELNAGMG